MYMRTLGNLGEIPANQRQYWIRFGKVNYGKTPEQLASIGITQNAIEETLKNEARRYGIFYKDPQFQGWFANRPGEYDLFRIDFPEYPPINFTEAKAAGQQYYSPVTEGQAMQYHLAEQGYSTSFNQEFVNPQPASAPVQSVFSIGPEVTASTSHIATPSNAPSNTPVPVTSAVTNAGLPVIATVPLTAAPTGAPVTSAGSGDSFSSGTGTIFEAGFPDVNASGTMTEQAQKSSLAPLLGLAALLMLGS